MAQEFPITATDTWHISFDYNVKGEVSNIKSWISDEPSRLSEDEH